MEMMLVEFTNTLQNRGLNHSMVVISLAASKRLFYCILSTISGWADDQVLLEDLIRNVNSVKDIVSVFDDLDTEWKRTRLLRDSFSFLGRFKICFLNHVGTRIWWIFN